MGTLGNLPGVQPLTFLAGNPGTGDGHAQALLGPRTKVPNAQAAITIKLGGIIDLVADVIQALLANAEEYSTKEWQTWYAAVPYMEEALGVTVQE